MSTDTITVEFTPDQAGVLLLSVREELEHNATSDWFIETLAAAESRVTDAYESVSDHE